MSSYLAKQQAFKEDPKAFSEGQYFGASLMPGTGEAIAAYELPGVLSQAKEMIQGDDTLRALGGLGLATLGTAAVLPLVGPGARALKKTLQGIEEFAPYMGPKLAAEGVDTSRLAMSDQGDFFTGSSPSAKTTDNLNLGSGSLFSAESKKGRKLLIVSCSDTKCPDDGDMKAMDRYLGPIFQTLKAQGVPPNVDVAIMSAKHGLITADTPLKNYNLKMTKDLASKFKGDPDQMNRIKNTMSGYDDVIVQGGKDYKDVLRTAAGDMNIKEIPGGRGIGDQRELMMNAIAPFRKINTPVYHYSPDIQLNFTKLDPDKSPAVIDSLGVHVGTKKAARDRFETRMNLGTGQLPGIDDMPTGNVGYGPDGKPIPRTTFGGTFPLLADTSKPFTPSTADSKRFAGDKEWSEFDLNEHLIDEFNKTLPKGQDFDGYYTMKHLSAEPGFEEFPFAKFREFVKDYRKKLAKDGYTHIPYINDVEDPSSTSFIMLVDRPKGKPKVLQGTFAKKDPAAADDPDLMKAEGGVVEMKERAINMNRGPQGIEPFIKYMQNGGNPELEMSGNMATPSPYKYEINEPRPPIMPIEKNLELEGIIQRIREEPIMDGNTIRYRTEEEIQRIIQQMLRQPNIDITPEGGIKIRPSVEIRGETPSSETFMGTLGGKELFLEDKDLRTRARLGVDVELPKGDRAGMGAEASYFKGTREFPEQLAQYGFPDKVRRGSGKINYGDIDAYYSMQGGPTISGRYNPVTEQYGGQINYGMPLRDMGIPQLSEKAVNMFRRLVR